MDFLGCETGLVMALLIGAPIGNVLAIFLVNKFFFRPHEFSYLSALVSLILSFIACFFFGIFLFDLIGGLLGFTAYQCTVVSTALFSYHLTMILCRKVKKVKGLSRQK